MTEVSREHIRDAGPSRKSRVGRPPKNGRRAMSDAQRAKQYRRNKSIGAKRKAARKARDEADRIVAEKTGGTYEVHHCSIDDVTSDRLPDASVAAIITDPPYAEKYLPLYSSLGRLSARVLKPGGWCVVMTGNAYLGEIMRRMEEHLEFVWPYSVPTPGGLNNRNYAVGLFQTWKLVLLFQKPPISRIREWWSDQIVAKPDEHNKAAHPWQQSHAVFEELARRFSRPDDLIVDPFAGSGTTGRAAISQGRHFGGVISIRNAALQSIVFRQALKTVFSRLSL
jgi:16S rRNA G966 N2-methylase RsmD